MKATINYPSWHQIDKACAVLANRIIRDIDPKDAPEAIIGLARGGLIPSVIISHILELKVYPVSYSSQAGQGEYKNYDNDLPHIPSGRLLIIDDIVDSGHTMKEIKDHYQFKHVNVYTASLFYKTSSVFKPDFYWQEIPADSPWIIFPWEI